MLVTTGLLGERARRLTAVLLLAGLLTSCSGTNSDPAASPLSGAGTSASPVVSASPRPGGAPVAVGVPEYADSSGAVEVYFPDGRHQQLTPGGLGLPPAQPWGDDPYALYPQALQFGSAVATADLNQDGIDDLVVGSEGGRINTDEDTPTAGELNEDFLTPHDADPAAGASGRVWILLGGSGGFTRDRMIRVPVPARVGDQAGAAVAVTPRASGTGHDLWVGAPGLTVGGRAQAGAVYRFSVTTRTTRATPTPTLTDTVTYDSRLVPGTAVGFDHFGSVLARVRNGVVVGVPDRTVRGLPQAGEIVRLRTDRSTDRMIEAEAFNQDSAAVPGRATRATSFGAAVAENGLAVAVPRARVEGRAGAGSVQLFTTSSARPDSLTPAAALHQGSPGVPGAPGRYVEFGTDVVAGEFLCPGVTSLAISSRYQPGDPPVPVTVTVVPLPGSDRSCAGTVLTGDGLPTTDTSGSGDDADLGTAAIDSGASARDQLLIVARLDDRARRIMLWPGPGSSLTTLGTAG
ncbi:FG-GAP repeat protein [Kineosporia sp. J2-2]|uniref:FG-GAP repeat protein n=1 Tax=Kineosporia corallincola TaxID=2835133 RepID=A0ABS5TPS0_9ACTN|nr:FG-GAP repeat protein [Kineosporia corallincola]MBT0772823.1 FG-GAP repeat protein [Kineosporia corallincola]